LHARSQRHSLGLKPPRYLIRDRDRVYGAAVTHRLRAMGIRDKPIAPGSPWLAARHVDCMNLEDVFCEIKTDCCNIAHGWLPLLVIFDDHHLGTSMPLGGHPPQQLAASSLNFAPTDLTCT
jgi:hypothetical protein